MIRVDASAELSEWSVGQITAFARWRSGMWEFIRIRRELTRWPATRTISTPGRRSRRRLAPEFLEDRTLMTASLQPIANLTVPALQGYTSPLDGSGTTDAQTFTVTSSNPDIAATIPQAEFWNVGVSYTDPVTSTNSFTGSLTFELFPGLTPNTVSMITQFTNDGYFTTSGKYFPRIVSNFGSTGTTVVQGGANNIDGTGSSGQPNTPFPNENVQRLALDGSDQLAMANAGGTDTNDSQFFINTGTVDSTLGYNYTVFGQLVAGQSTLTQMTQIPVQQNPATGEDSQPVNPLTITSAALSATNPNGVVLLDTTQAKPGETATITVTATDSTDHTQVSQSFVVTVGGYAGPATYSQVGNVNFKPYANPTTASVVEGIAQQIQLAGQNTYPDPSQTVPLTYSLVTQPAHGTISNFNASTGTLTYTPNSGFLGTDTFQYKVQATGPNQAAAAATSNAGTVTVSVIPTPPPVTLSKVQLVQNKTQQVTQVIVFFSSPLDTTDAGNKTIYRLATPGKGGSYSARNAGIIRVRKAVYSAAGDSVTLTPAAPFSLKKPVQLLIQGAAPSGLQDFLGRYIDGADNGQAGSDAIAILSRSGVVL
jgi:cyclophilin family peptidyl-prolyl cis-trans isomerase